MEYRAVRLPAPAAAQLLSALDAELAAKQRELSEIEAPQFTPHDLCRGFARALEEQLSARGRAVLRAFGGLAPALCALLFVLLFAPAHVRDVCARADGYQPYLVSPEAGLRALVQEAVELFRPPVRACLDASNAALDAIVRYAIATAASHARAQHRPKCEVRVHARAHDA